MQYQIINTWEHFKGVIPSSGSIALTKERYQYLFKKKKGEDLACFSISKKEEKLFLETGYFVGLDWVETQQSAIYIAPKLNTKADESIYPKNLQETDYLKMLFSALKHPDVVSEVDELFVIKWEAPTIEIEQKQDLLTPLLVVEFLSILKTIVRKGLKKAYYKVEKNLHGRVKGKILIGKTIKHNILNNKNLHTYCTFEEFGLNSKENRLLKKALVFVQRYLPTYPNLDQQDYLKDLFHYINPAFSGISSKIELSELKYAKTNAFYKEYEKAIGLAKLILKRFGYHISNIEKQKIATPPFWIDMGRLFELYVLGLLKDRFQNQVTYHFTTYGNELDFLLKSKDFKMVIDAKYKPKYKNGKNHQDIRQVSGYARLEKVYEHLEITYPNSINCLIIYPNQEEGLDNLQHANFLEHRIEGYCGIYKLGVKLPMLHLDA